MTTVTADGEYVLCWRRSKKGARHGQDRRLLTLADLALSAYADPSRYQHLLDKERKEPDGLPIQGTPDEMRAVIARELVKVAKRMLTLGATITSAAVRVTSRKKVGGSIKKSLGSADRVVQDARNLAYILSQLERDETATKRLPGRTRAVEQGNVVTGAFAAAGD